MLPRRLSACLNRLLSHSPAVVLLGPRQVGKTTLALEIGATRPSIYLDLEDEDDRAKLSNPTRYFADHEADLEHDPEKLQTSAIRSCVETKR